MTSAECADSSHADNVQKPPLMASLALEFNASTSKLNRRISLSFSLPAIWDVGRAAHVCARGSGPLFSEGIALGGIAAFHAAPQPVRALLRRAV